MQTSRELQTSGKEHQSLLSERELPARRRRYELQIAQRLLRKAQHGREAAFTESRSRNPAHSSAEVVSLLPKAVITVFAGAGLVRLRRIL